MISDQFVHEIILGSASVNQLKNLLEFMKKPVNEDHVNSIKNLIYSTGF